MEGAPDNVSRDDDQDGKNGLGTRSSRQKPTIHAGGKGYLPNSPVSTTTGNTRSCASVVNCPLNFFALATVSPAVAVAVAVAMMYDLIARKPKMRGRQRVEEMSRAGKHCGEGAGAWWVLHAIAFLRQIKTEGHGPSDSCARATKGF